MPHYADGTPAKIGDRVRGCGYNSKSQGYDPAVGIDGWVTHVRPGEKCTLTVAYLKMCLIHPNPWQDGMARSNGATVVAEGLPFRVELEYGDTQCFNKIGEVQ